MITRKIDKIVLQNNEGQLTVMQTWIIGYLDGNSEKELFQKDIEAEFNIRRSTATGILQLMEKKGYITRQSINRDARLKSIVLTPKAKDLALRVKKSIVHAEDELTNGLNPKEIDALFVIIDKIKANIG
jgi:DNA-binding MarR family transcriptional regulator